jgi:hypothetical protein
VGGAVPPGPRRMITVQKPRNGFKIWTALLSVFVAVMLFPAIVGRHGVTKSLAITALAVGVIWVMYFGIGKLVEHAVSEELRRRSLKQPENRPAKETREESKP